MRLLLPGDYKKLEERGITFEESEPQRYFIFTAFGLPERMFAVEHCDVLVMIPPNYNQAGNDMLWTYPRLVRTNGQPIPASNDLGGGDNRMWGNREFCRWSRHWNSGPSVWRPMRDDILTIFRRVKWVFEHPNCQ